MNFRQDSQITKNALRYSGHENYTKNRPPKKTAGKPKAEMGEKYLSADIL